MVNVQRLTLKNFLSYGNKLTTFDFSNGITLFISDNKLSSNGVGKSTPIDALCFVLYGKAYRKIKNSSLQNYINPRDLLVELELNTKNKSYKIIRGLNPNKFEIYTKEDDTWNLILEESKKRDYQKFLEEDILETPEEVFRSLIALGIGNSASKSFLEMSQKDKEEMFGNLTDTIILRSIREQIKKNINQNKTFLQEYNYKQEVLKNSIDSERNSLEKQKELNRVLQTEKEYMITQLTDSIYKKQKELEELKSKIPKLKEFKNRLDTLVESKSKIENSLDDLQNKKYSLEKEIHSIESRNKDIIECPKCKTKINGEFQDTSSLQEEVKGLEDNISEVKQEQNIILEEIDSLRPEILKHKSIKEDISSKEQEILKLENQLDRFKKQEIQEVDESNLERLSIEYKEVKNLYQKTYSKIEDYNFLSTFCNNNNLREMILSKQLPILNKFINQYLEKFSLNSYRMVIDLDFKEKITSRLDNEFNQLSQGQKMRITLSVMFALLKFIETRNGVTWNILFLDELLDNSLDANGRAEVLEILKEDFSNHKNIVIISHNEEIKSRDDIFNRIVTISRKSFSEIKVEEIQ